MPYIDLSHTFSHDMPVYPGDPKPEFFQVASLEKEGYTDFQLKTGMHVGTHIDAPFHMIAGGKRLSEIAIDRFVGRGVLVDARGQSVVGPELLEGLDVRTDGVVLVMTGFDQFFRESRYYVEYPEISEAFARRLVELGVKIVGMDTPSPDRSPFSVHKILLGADALIVENLTNLSALTGVASFEVMAFPPRLDIEGAPVRVVACVNQ